MIHMEGDLQNKNNYPQKYFLEGEACKYFGLKFRTYRRWIDGGETIPGRLKVKGSNYYVIEPVAFHKYLINHKLEEGKYDGPKKTAINKRTVNETKTNRLHQEGIGSASHY